MFETLTRLFRRRPTPIVLKIVPVDNSRVEPSDRAKLRQWLKDPVTQLALGIVESQLPSIMQAGLSGTVEERRYSAEKRLLQLQGWYSYRNTLLGVDYTPEQIKQMIEETYPEPK